jgi:hypothetical protein
LTTSSKCVRDWTGLHGHSMRCGHPMVQCEQLWTKGFTKPWFMIALCYDGSTFSHTFQYHDSKTHSWSNIQRWTYVLSLSEV